MLLCLMTTSLANWWMILDLVCSDLGYVRFILTSVISQTGRLNNIINHNIASNIHRLIPKIFSVPYQKYGGFNSKKLQRVLLFSSINSYSARITRQRNSWYGDDYPYNKCVEMFC
jgi:hypothetical protein